MRLLTAFVFSYCLSVSAAVDPQKSGCVPRILEAADTAMGYGPNPIGAPSKYKMDAPGQDRMANALFATVIRPVLEEGGRLGNAPTTWRRVNSPYLGWDVSTQNGTYTFLITHAAKPTDDELGNSVPEVKFDITSGNRMHGTAYFQERWLEPGFLKDEKNVQLLQGFVRALMIGDPDVSPHMRSPRAGDKEESVLSYMQQTVMRDSMRAIAAYKAREPKRVPRVGIVGPGGMGKTILVTALAKALFEGKLIEAIQQAKVDNGLVVFAVESDSVLKSALEKIVRELDLDPKDVWAFFGQNKQHEPVVQIGKVRVLLTSRTGLFKLCESGKMAELIGRGAKKRRTILVLDEAQHIPAQDLETQKKGQFIQSLQTLEGVILDKPGHDQTQNALLDENDLIVAISATMTHSSVGGLIKGRQFLDRSIVGVLLDEEETRQLMNGDNNTILELAARQAKRAMVLGYLAWINIVRVQPIRDPDGKSVLNRKTIGVGEDGAPAKFEVVEPRVIQDVADQILALRKQKPHIKQRALIFVEGMHRSNEFAKQLQAEIDRRGAEAGDLPSQVCPFHSGKGSFADTQDWMQDRRVCTLNARGNIVLGNDYSTPQSVNSHKFAVVDSIIGEGADLPNINMIIIARDVNVNDTGSIMRLYQNILRGTRVYAFKQELLLIDYSGVVNDFFDGKLNVRPLDFADPEEEGPPGGGSDGPSLPVAGALLHSLGALKEDQITRLVLDAQEGIASEYGSAPPQDIFLLKRAPFHMSRPEGQELAKLLLQLVRDAAKLDRGALPGTQPGKA
ncbi:AAA family ATPase, partial [bacterium]|nr:AAA family ATPase [bacterium]